MKKREVLQLFQEWADPVGFQQPDATDRHSNFRLTGMQNQLQSVIYPP